MRTDLPSPAQVSPAMIERCRKEVEGSLKAFVRRLLIPLMKLRYRFAEIGEGFQWGLPIAPAPGACLGKYVYIGAGFSSVGKVIVGDLTMISMQCQIVGDDHLIDQVGTPTRLAFNRADVVTVIGTDVWIGARSTIKAGVKLGDGCVIATGSVVTKDVEPYSVVAGVPAKKLRDRFATHELPLHNEALFAGASK